MAMNGTTLGDAMYAALKSSLDLGDGDLPPEARDALRALGGAIVAHITGAGAVSAGITVSVDPVTGIGATTSPGAIT